MRIKIKNEELVRVMTFLDGLAAKGKMSLARSRMIDLVKKKHQEYLDERKQIIEAHAEKDENDKPITNEDGTYKLTSKGNAEAGKEIIDLNKDFSVIEYGEYIIRINDLEQFLGEFDGELSGDAAQGFFVLMDAFETKEEN